MSLTAALFMTAVFIRSVVDWSLERAGTAFRDRMKSFLEHSNHVSTEFPGPAPHHLGFLAPKIYTLPTVFGVHAVYTLLCIQT